MAAETGFKINGVFYEHPFATWDLDDAQEMYDRTGLTIEDWAIAGDPDLPEDDAYELAQKFKNPNVLRTLAAIAYWKKHKDVTLDEIVALVGPAQYRDVIEGLVGGDDSPPALTTEPEKPSESGTVASNETSGSDSQESSDAPAVRLAPTGTTG